MWSPPKTNRWLRRISAILLASSALAGCSDIYFDRRETIALGADDAKASNEIVQIIDPWPPHVGQRQIAFDGTKMQTAVERYRTNRTYTPVNVTTSSVAYEQAEQAAAAAASANNTLPPGMSAPAAPVK
jgi:hypothetical protein